MSGQWSNYYGNQQISAPPLPLSQRQLSDECSARIIGCTEKTFVLLLLFEAAANRVLVSGGGRVGSRIALVRRKRCR